MSSLNNSTVEQIAEQIAGRIEDIRLAKNIRQSTITDRLGMSRTTYNQFTKGKCTLATFIGVLECIGELASLEDLVDGPVPASVTRNKNRQRACPSAGIRRPFGNPHARHEEYFQ